MQEVLLLQNTLREARRWQLMAFILAAFVLLLVVTVMSLFPLRKTEIKYVEFSESGKHNFRIVPSPLEKKQSVLLIRQILREYVIKRISYTGNIHIDTPAVKQVAAMSSREVLGQFKEVYERIHIETTIERREVSIITDIPIGKNAHQVQYRTIDYFDGQKYENHWVATIAYEFEKQIATEEDELLNPLGIVVTEFIEARKKLSDEDLNEIF
jgi:type IV secretory pathway component VirB8